MAYIINIGGGNGITEEQARDLLAKKQDLLVSGTNIKTINNQSLIDMTGGTNIVITPATQETVEE